MMKIGPFAAEEHNFGQKTLDVLSSCLWWACRKEDKNLEKRK
jgi:hypothetical protein